jgi:hypothetical protein
MTFHEIPHGQPYEIAGNHRKPIVKNPMICPDKNPHDIFHKFASTKT